MQIRILGPLEVVTGGKTIELARTDEARVLALLAARPNQLVPSSELCNAIWPHRDHRDSRARLPKRVMRLRQLLGSPGRPRSAQRWLTTEGSGYVLRVSTNELDASEFFNRLEEGLAALQRGEYTKAAAELRTGLRLWRGHALGDLAQESFAREEVARLEEARMSALEGRIEADLALGRHAELCSELEELVERHPHRARLRRQVILALYRSDRQADALRVAARFRQRLDARESDEASELAQLEQDILLQKPYLDQVVRDEGHVDVRPPAFVGLPDDHARALDLDVTAATSSLIGRRAERQWLVDRLDEAMRGVPQVVLLRGEVGVGKSRLARELVEEARDRGVATSIGRFREQQSVPFDAFVGDFFERLADVARDDSELASRVELIAGLETFTPDHDDASAITDADRLAAVRQSFAHLIARQPFMLLVDDLQWADSASLELIVNLVRLAADAAVRKLVYLFVVLIVRDEVGVPERAELDLLKRETITASLTLHGLTELEVSRLANAVGAHDLPRAVVSDVTRVTRGNPLFVVALVKQFAASRGGRRSDTVASGRLPSELQGLIGTRVSGLSSTCQDMLTMAAVLGKGCSLAELETVTGIEPDELGELLDEAEDADVLVDSGDHYDFAHPLYERAVLARLSNRRRREAHRRIADVLIQRGEDASASPMAIAQHLLDAGEFADPALVFEHCPSAGDSASAALAPGDAARYYEAALSAAERLRDPPREPLAHLALRAAVTRLQNGEPAAALHDADAAIANLGADAPADALARAWSARLRAELMARTPGHPVDIGPLETLAPELETSAPRVAARVYGALANYYANAARDVDKARWACTRAIDLGNRHDEHSACADGWGQLAVTQWIHLELADAVESLRAESFHATRCGDRSKLSHSMALLPLTLVWLGRFDEAETAIDQARRASREMSFFLREGFVALAEALLAAARGMYIESDAAVEDAIEIGRLSGDQWPTTLIMQLLAWTRFLRGDDEGTEAVLEQWAPAGAPADRAMFAWLLRQHGAAATGSPPALLELEALWARLSSSPGFSADTAAVLVVELAAEVGASELAAQAGEFLADLAHRGQVFTTTMGLFIPRAVGVAAAACGDNADARARLEKGIELATALRAHAELAASEYTLASVLVDEAEKEGALPLLESAHRTAGALGLLPLARRCEALAQRLDTSLLEPSRLHHPGRRTTRGSEPIAATEMAVVMFTDIVDSVALTEELGDWVFHDRARALQASLRRTIRTLAGRPVEGIKLGDGILAEFRSAEPAIRCAVTCSTVANDAGLPLHIGLHAGDVIRDQGDIYGGSVNTAARICSQAPAGHVLVSQTIRDLARTSSAFTFRPLGPHALKGIAEPVPLFSVEAAS